ncbi:MAG TPA: BON domain-containing protein [Flavisolibacter sp.]|nr:BON domain-containing protein [Flavisolibacter sp.]
MKNDLQIQQDVMNQLKWNPFLKASEIGVSIKNGIATLSGQVDSYAQKMEAERTVRKVTGVKAIAEDIEIGVSPSYRKSDTEIAGSVLNALKWHSAVPDDKLEVKVEDGIVTLGGEVEWEYQRNSARNAVVNLVGVRSVINNIAIKPKASAGDVKSKITSALLRTATIDAERISVEVVGNKVILKGKVRSNTEKEDAEEAAWFAPGIAMVESQLELIPQEELMF